MISNGIDAVVVLLRALNPDLVLPDVEYGSSALLPTSLDARPDAFMLQAQCKFNARNPDSVGGTIF
jgi:uncharacterized membrane protein